MGSPFERIGAFLLGFGSVCLLVGLVSTFTKSGPISSEPIPTKEADTVYDGGGEFDTNPEKGGTFYALDQEASTLEDSSEMQQRYGFPASDRQVLYDSEPVVDTDTVNISTYSMSSFSRSGLSEPENGYGVFDCQSSKNFGDVVMNEHKGIALDDTTLQNCANEVPTHWPNTNVKIKTVRLFKTWGMTKPIKFKGDYHHAWKGLKGFAQASGAKFLIGVSVTCDANEDEREWAAGREFIKYVGAEHIMGLAVGNELDLQVGGGYCKGALWRGQYLSTFKQRVREFDAIPGMAGLPVTAVLSMNSLIKGATWPFLKGLYQKYGDRYKFSMNIYPQFSGGLAQAGCDRSIDIGTKFSMGHPAGFMPNSVADIHRQLKKNGLGNMKIWIGEQGWATHAYCRLCGKACSDKRVQEKFYKNWLKWDLEASDTPSGCGPPQGKCAESIRWVQTDGMYSHPEWFPNLNAESSTRDIQIDLANRDTAEARGGCNLPCDAPGASSTASGPRVEHTFYFTVRDSSVFGQSEAFGILEKCGNNKCKFQ